MRAIVMIALSVALMPAITQAQAKAKPTPAPTAQAAPAPAAAPAIHINSTDAPQITEADKFTLDDFDAQIAPLYAQMSQIQAKRNAWVQSLNKSHPGWHWQDSNQQGESGHFVLNTPAPAPPK